MSAVLETTPDCNHEFLMFSRSVRMKGRTDLRKLVASISRLHLEELSLLAVSVRVSMFIGENSENVILRLSGGVAGQNYK